MKARSEKTQFVPFDLTRVKDYLELVKPGITLLITASMLIGFLLASADGIDYLLLLHAIIGTLFIAGGTAAHNQYIERDLDKQMVRTKNRPLPARKIEPNKALLYSLTLMLIGLLYLLMQVNLAAGLVSAVTTLMYLGLYTPLKKKSFANVYLGSIPGALPPVGGWAAVTGGVLDPGAWLLFGIVFLWQVPHVIAIAWLAREDYERAGFVMLPANDEGGFRSMLHVMGCLLLLFPVSVLLQITEGLGVVYLVGGMASCLIFLYTGLLFTRQRSRDTAKKVMFGSLFFLPLIWLFIIADLLVQAWLV